MLDYLRYLLVSASNAPNGVIYATPDGLMMIGSSGPRLLTAPYFTRNEWRLLNPQSMHGCLFEGRYIVFYKVDENNKGALMFDPADTEAGVTFLDFWASASYADALADSLYLCMQTAGVNKVVRWDADAARPLPCRWRSGLMVSPEPMTYQAARVLADSYMVNHKNK